MDVTTRNCSPATGRALKKSGNDELATQTRNTTRLAGQTATFNKLTIPTPLQAHAHELVASLPVTT